jgi:hypothetical protein
MLSDGLPFEKIGNKNWGGDSTRGGIPKLRELYGRVMKLAEEYET